MFVKREWENLMSKSKKYYALLRQWKMLQLLPVKVPKSAVQIRDELEREGFQVDLRTVQRDLKELMEVFPLTARKGKPISWRWDRNAMSFEIPGMDRAGALTLKMVSDFMSRLLPKNCLDSLAPKLRRAEAILNDLDGKIYGGWLDKVRVVPRNQPLLPPHVDSEVLDVVYESLFQDRRFKAMYLKRNESEPVEYIVNPLGLVASDPTLYLVATLWDYENIKLLAVHRFQTAEMIYEKVRKPEGFTLDNYLASGALGFARHEGKKIQLRSLFDKYAAAHLYESPLSSNQKITEQEDGDILVEAEVLDTLQLRWWLLGFGDNVEVVGPKALRQELTETIRNMVTYYED